MKIKRILKFYFGADSLNAALDNLIYRYAFFQDGVHDGEYFAEKIIEIISRKRELSKLWLYLDGRLGGLPERELKILRFYGLTRRGLGSLSDVARREIKRVTTKAVRRLKNLERYEEALKLVSVYYCLIYSSPTATERCVCRSSP